MLTRCLTLILLMTPLACAQSKPYTQMYVFGDSYSDSGAGYVDGNGPTAVVYLAQRIGIPFTYFGDPKTQGEHPIREGLNFAVSGARTDAGEGRRGPHRELLGRGMRNQVVDFTTMVKACDIRFDPKTTMFFLLGGLNDGSLPEGSTKANEEALIDTLYAVGARRFMVGVLPTKIPGFAAVAERLNPSLLKIPADEKAMHPDIRIANSDWGRYFDTVLEHPAHYGITNTTDRCAGRALRNEDTTPCATPASYFYFHAEHPSTAVHKAVGDMLYDEALRTGDPR